MKQIMATHNNGQLLKLSWQIILMTFHNIVLWNNQLAKGYECNEPNVVFVYVCV